MDLDRLLGIDTSLTDQNWDRGRCHPCQPTPMAALEAVAERLTRETHLADYGCGTGRAVFYLAYLAGCRVTGVELDTRRYAAARDNLQKCARKKPELAERIQILHLAAQDYEPDEDAFYCFNPFPAQVLRGVLKKIDLSLLKRPRAVKLFVYYPDLEWQEVLIEQGWTLCERIDLRAQLGRDEREQVDVFEFLC